MSEGLAAVQSRVADLARLTGSRPTTMVRSAASGAAFEQMLAGLTSGTGASDVVAELSGLPGLLGTAVGAPGGGTSTVRASGAPSSAATARALEDKVVGIARQYLGIPYLWGGTDPHKGLDCSGLTQLVYRQVGVDLPRVSRDQAKAGVAVASMDQARPGDLLFFNSPVDHVGIYVGDGKMLDAPRSGKDVQVRDVWETPSAIRRVLPAAGAAGAAAAGPAGPYSALFTAAGRRHGVDPALLSAVAKAESGYDPRAVSPAGARGLMQIMPGTARELGVDPMAPEQAVDGAARLLARHLKRYDGSVDLALAAYNAGPGAVNKYGGVPPYEETRTYIQRVTRTWEALR